MKIESVADICQLMADQRQSMIERLEINWKVGKDAPLYKKFDLIESKINEIIEELNKKQDIEKVDEILKYWSDEDLMQLQMSISMLLVERRKKKEESLGGGIHPNKERQDEV